VQDLVNYILGAGVWLDEQQGNREKAVTIAAGRKYFNQDPNIIRFVMENPTDRVTYGDLRLIRDEFEELMLLSIEAGMFNSPVAFDKYVDESFANAAHPAVIGL
jgi:NitT/TauT family transport system substrate-binding protein